MERERERDRILVPRLRRGQRIVEQSRGSPRHPLLPSEFSIVPRVVPLAIFARLALSQIRFPLPLSLSLLVLIGYRFSSSSPGLPAERKRSNSAGNRRLHTYSQERESTRVVSSRNSIYSFFSLSLLPPRWNNSRFQRLIILSRTLSHIHQVASVPSTDVSVIARKRSKVEPRMSKRVANGRAMGLSRWSASEVETKSQLYRCSSR